MHELTAITCLWVVAIYLATRIFRLSLRSECNWGRLVLWFVSIFLIGVVSNHFFSLRGLTSAVLLIFYFIGISAGVLRGAALKDHGALLYVALFLFVTVAHSIFLIPTATSARLERSLIRLQW